MKQAIIYILVFYLGGFISDIMHMYFSLDKKFWETRKDYPISTYVIFWLYTVGNSMRWFVPQSRSK